MLPVEPDRGLITYGVLDIVFGWAYLYLGLSVAPSRSPMVQGLVWILFSVLVLSGVALILRRRWSGWVGLAGAGVVLGFTLFLISALALSAAYLRGVYGGFGKGAATICILAAFLAVEVFGLLPVFQIRFLLRPEVRRRLRPPAGPTAAPPADATPPSRPAADAA